VGPHTTDQVNYGLFCNDAKLDSDRYLAFILKDS
jgi:hypothetical protein